MIFGICDDDLAFADKIQQQLQKFYRDKEQSDIICKIYSSGEELIQSYKNDQIDVVFMDIEVGDELGFSIAKKLVHIDRELAIVYMTNHENYITSAFVCRPLGFIRKKFLEQDFIIAMEEVDSYIGAKYKTITFASGEEVLLYNIHVIEVYDHRMVILFKEHSLVVKDNLKKYEEELRKNDFAKISRNRVVNLRYVIEMNGKKIETQDGYKLEISKNRLREIRDTWKRYCMLH